MRVWRLAASAAVVAWALPAMAEPPPASAFGRIPAIVQAAISPDGKHVAMLGGASDQRIVSIATIDQPGLPILPLGDVEAVSIRWADSAHVITRFANWYDAGPRHAYRIERNVVVDLDAHLGPILLRHDAASSLLLEQPVLGLTPASPPRAIMLGLAESTAADNDLGTLIHRKGSGEAVTLGLFSVDLASGKGELLERGSPDTGSWEVDAEGRPRVRLDFDAKDHGMTVLARAKDRNQYTALWSTDLEGRRGYFGYSAPDDAIYLGQDGGIVRKRLADGAVEPVNHQPIEGSPRVLWDDRREAAVGVESGAEKPVIEWFDPEIGAVHATLTKVLQGQAVEISSWSDDRTRFVARAAAPGSPGVWYLFDKTRKEVSPLGEEYPELKGVALGTTRWITYKARDGLQIPAYLTLPPAGAGSAKPPLVVLPHGGPAARDDYDFDFLAQYLATRGYAVLQPQFRGSWGFGKAFEDAGRGEWGGKMQTDLLDGVAAVAASGAADTSRVCIVGASFGGYAALAGAALHPDSYKCAAAIAGVADLGLMLVEEGRTYGRESTALEEWRTMLGRASPEQLAAQSPAKQAAAIKVPILLIHGDKDTVVAPEQSELMANALKAAGKPYDYVVLAGENHYLTKSATRTQMLETVGAFLAKNLPVSR